MSSEFRQFDEHGLPIPQRYVDMRPEDDAPPRTARFSQRSKRIFLVILILGVIVPLVFGPKIVRAVREAFANGLQTRAEQKMGRRDYQGAIDDLNQAIAWNPDGWKHYEARSIARARSNDLSGSLEDLTKTIDVFNDFWNNGNHRRRREIDRSIVLASVYSRRSWINVRLGNRAAAIDDANQAVNLDLTPENLNSRAYARAILKVNLSDALADADRAVKGADARRKRLLERPMTMDDRENVNALCDEQMSSYLDTRGYVNCLLDQTEAAIDDLNKAISLGENFRGFVVARPEIFDSGELGRVDESLAVMHHHRGEVHEKMGRTELADKDIKRAELLGYNPENGVF